MQTKFEVITFLLPTVQSKIGSQGNPTGVKVKCITFFFFFFFFTEEKCIKFVVVNAKDGF